MQNESATRLAADLFFLGGKFVPGSIGNGIICDGWGHGSLGALGSCEMCWGCSYPYDEGSFVHLWNEVQGGQILTSTVAVRPRSAARMSEVVTWNSQKSFQIWILLCFFWTTTLSWLVSVHLKTCFAFKPWDKWLHLCHLGGSSSRDTCDFWSLSGGCN